MNKGGTPLAMLPDFICIHASGLTPKEQPHCLTFK